MSHTVRGKKALLARVRRIQGQFRALERALEDERDCGEILHLIAATRGASNGLMAEVLEEHLRLHVPNADGAAGEIVNLVRSYLR